MPRTAVFEFNGFRFVEIGDERPISIFLIEELWLHFIEPLKKDKGIQETQVRSILNEFDYAVFRREQYPSKGALYFSAHLLEPFCSKRSYVTMKADVWKCKPQCSAVFMEVAPLGWDKASVVIPEV